MKPESKVKKAKRLFIRNLQREYGAILGRKVGADRAWALFKGSIATLIISVVSSEQEKITLLGIGKFFIHYIRPGKRSAMTPLLKEKGTDKVPSFKWKLSTGIRKFLITRKLGEDVAEKFLPWLYKKKEPKIELETEFKEI